jgi:hypothetical protein
MTLLGIGNACVWAPNSATATRNLPPQQAGAGAGVYNATRQLGAVLGSAAIAVLMDSRLAGEGLTFAPSEGGTVQQLPQQVQAPFADAMSAAMLLPPTILLLGLLAVLFFERPRHPGWGGAPAARDAAPSAVTRGYGR